MAAKRNKTIILLGKILQMKPHPSRLLLVYRHTYPIIRSAVVIEILVVNSVCFSGYFYGCWWLKTSTINFWFKQLCKFIAFYEDHDVFTPFLRSWLHQVESTAKRSQVRQLLMDLTVLCAIKFFILKTYFMTTWKEYIGIREGISVVYVHINRLQTLSWKLTLLLFMIRRKIMFVIIPVRQFLFLKTI